MISSALENLADMIMESEKNTVKDKEIIVYGLKSAITQGLSIITTAVLGCIFGLFWESIVFLVSFSGIRMYAGGYHCKKSIHCYLFSTLMVVIVLLIVKITPVKWVILISIAMLIVAIPVIWEIAPIETITKPLDDIEKKHFGKKTILHLGIECIVITMLFLLGLYSSGYVMCLGIMLSAVLVFLQYKLI